MEILSCFGNRRLLPEKNTTANGHKIYPPCRNCERAGRKSAAAEKAICLSPASNGADDGQCSLFKDPTGCVMKPNATVPTLSTPAVGSPYESMNP
jgi:hypothetical protein